MFFEERPPRRYRTRRHHYRGGTRALIRVAHYYLADRRIVRRWQCGVRVRGYNVTRGIYVTMRSASLGALFWADR